MTDNLERLNKIIRRLEQSFIGTVDVTDLRWEVVSALKIIVDEIERLRAHKEE